MVGGGRIDSLASNFFTGGFMLAAQSDSTVPAPPSELELAASDAVAALPVVAGSSVIEPWTYDGHAVHALRAAPERPEGPAVLLVHGFGAS
ncbi:MAG: hypothetical protein ACOYND_10590, partial [Bacteroidota bacterium]